MRDRSEPWVLLGVFLGAALIFGGGMLSVWASPGLRWSGGAAVVAIVAGVAFGGVAVVLIRVSWRRHGGRASVLERTRAVRTGVLPADADASWLRGLRVRRQNATQFRWLYPGLAVLMLLLGTSHLGDASPVAPIYWFLLAAVMVGYAIFWWRRGPRDVAVIDRFVAEIEARSA